MRINNSVPANIAVKISVNQKLADVESHLLAGQFETAISLLSEIDLNAQPSSVVSTRDFLLGRAYLETKQSSLALDALNRAVHAQKNNAGFRLAYGAALHLNNDLEAAEKHYREAIRLSPLAENPHFNLAKVLTDRADVDGAIRAYRTALLRKPNYTNALAELANLLGLQDKPIEALDLLNRALNINPKHALSWHIYGKLLERANNYVEAANNYQKAVDCDPLFAEGWYDLARMTQQANDTHAAKSHIENALAIDANNEKYLFLKASLGASVLPST